MPQTGEQRAIENLRQRLGAPEDPGDRAWRVRRLDRSGGDFFLVVLGHEGASRAVGTVDAASGQVQSHARLTGATAHVVVDARKAAELAAGGSPASAVMVWAPCQASKSPLYPLWEVTTPAGVKYVDQQGNVWSELQPARPGGGTR